MKIVICNVALAPVRKEPAHRSEMINQLLFGDTVQVLETKEEWLCIRSLYDNYEGWLTEQLVEELNLRDDMETKYLAPDLYNIVSVNGAIIYAPMGASLAGLNDNGSLWRKDFVYKGNIKKANDPFDPAGMLLTARQWLHSPYLWGGRSFMGVDCSGFVQVVFKLHGIALARDAWQQSEQGIAIGRLVRAQPGDLAFFENGQGRVVHVGILLDNKTIIHASGKVRIDIIDEGGIINAQNGKRTHQFHSIRRVMK